MIVLLYVGYSLINILNGFLHVRSYISFCKLAVWTSNLLWLEVIILLLCPSYAVYYKFMNNV